MPDPTLRRLDDRAWRDLLAGTVPPGRSDLARVARFVTDLRDLYGEHPTPEARPELEAVFAAGLPADAGERTQPVATTEAVGSERRLRRARRRPVAPGPTRRRPRLAAALTAFLGTLAGKMVLGTALAAAAVGGAHTAGVVELPGLPDRAPPADQELDAAPGDAVDPAEQRGDPGVDAGAVSEDAQTLGGPDTATDGWAFGMRVRQEALSGSPAEGRAPDEPPASAETGEERRQQAADGTPGESPPADPGTGEAQRAETPAGAATSEQGGDGPDGGSGAGGNGGAGQSPRP